MTFAIGTNGSPVETRAKAKTQPAIRTETAPHINEASLEIKALSLLIPCWNKIKHRTAGKAMIRQLMPSVVNPPY